MLLAVAGSLFMPQQPGQGDCSIMHLHGPLSYCWSKLKVALRACCCRAATPNPARSRGPPRAAPPAPRLVAVQQLLRIEEEGAFSGLVNGPSALSGGGIGHRLVAKSSPADGEEAAAGTGIAALFATAARHEGRAKDEESRR